MSHELENLTNILANVNDAIFVIDSQYRISYCNPAAERLYGYSKDEVLSQNFDSHIVPEDKKTEFSKLVKRAVSTGDPVKNVTTTRRHKDGSNIDVTIAIVALKDPSGAFNAYCEIAQTTSDQKKYETRAKEHAHFIQQVAGISRDIIYVMDLNTMQLIYTNRQVALELGYSRQQIAGMKNSFLDIMHEDDRVKMKEHIKKVKTLASDDTILEIEYRMKTAKGGWKWYCDRNSVYKRNERKIPVEKIGVAEDITTVKEQQETIFTERDIMSHAEQMTRMGSWEFDVETRDFQWSQGMYRLFNIPADTELSPDIYLDYTPREEWQEVKQLVDDIKQNYQAFERTITLLPAHAEKKIVRVKAAVHRDEKNKPLRVIGVDVDVTDQVIAGEEIIALNQVLIEKNTDLEGLNNELKTFNHVAAQDYKQTIQVLYTNLEYVIGKEARNLSDTSKANIRRAQSAIQRMKLLTDDINQYLQLYDVKLEKTTIDPNVILKDVISLLGRKIEQTAALVEYTDLPPMVADRTLFTQLLINLIDNSIKFRKLIVPPVIKIRYSHADEMNTVTAAKKNTAYTVISISDNGIGFNDEQAEKIFDLFYRIGENPNHKGSGIGLAVCKKIMNMHRGFITAEGVPATGAIFNCYFPSAG